VLKIIARDRTRLVVPAVRVRTDSGNRINLSVPRANLDIRGECFDKR
jgi:hypothetical protein